MNYWKIELSDLPSKGLYYDQDTVIKIRTLTVGEVKYLATYNKINATTIVNQLLSNALQLKKLKFEDLILGDREYLLFWLRTNTFIRSGSGYKIKINNCPNCHNEFEQVFPAKNFKIKHIEERIDNVELPDIGITIPLRQPRVKDIIPYNPNIDLDFAEMAPYLDTNNTNDEKIAFIQRLDGYDFCILQHEVNQIKCGMVKDLQIECPDCHNLYDVKLVVTDDNLFSSTSIKDILTQITHIAKYTNLQITDDWPYMEFEIEQEIVNAMIKKENDETQKEINKAKSKQNSVHVPSNPSLPNVRMPNTHF